MQLEKVFAELNLDASYLPVVSLNWEKSVVSCPAATLPFLEHEFYEKYYSLINADHKFLPLLADTATTISASNAAKLLAWHAHRTLCEYDREKSKFQEWPEMSEFLGENCGLFYLIIGLSSIPEWVKSFRLAGIPEQYALDCAPWLGGTIVIYQSAHNGQPGLTRQQLRWTGWYMINKLFRIGRFEYMNQELSQNYPTVFRHKINGQIIALCNAGWRLDENGFCLYNAQTESEAYLIAELIEESNAVTGIPISPLGHALPKNKIKLALAEWEKVLGPGDFAPGIHIPGGGGMSLDVCGESLHLASNFYRKYFPDKPVKAFVCASWIFNPQLEAALPESNLANFMRQLYLSPWPSNGRDGMFFIFGRDAGDFKTYPRDNSIRRAMLEILDSGQKLRSGGMFILPEHINHFGEEYYRKNWRLSQT
ncbi:MAG: hypothetical protein WC071_01460 [Victivallaceae bacterium]